MAKRGKRAAQKTNQAAGGTATEARLVAYAEQLGWLVGTVHAKSDGWLDRATLSKNLARIRDGAADLLAHLAKPGGARRRKRGQSAPESTRRNRGVVDAPGKRHRAAPPSTPGVKHSDERISKVKAEKTRTRARG